MSLLLLSSCVVMGEVWPGYTPLPARPGAWTSLGNHRFNLTLSPRPTTTEAEAVATVVWRRSDPSPLSKAVFIFPASNSSSSTANTTTPLPCKYVTVSIFDFFPTLPFLLTLPNRAATSIRHRKHGNRTICHEGTDAHSYYVLMTTQPHTHPPSHTHTPTHRHTGKCRRCHLCVHTGRRRR